MNSPSSSIYSKSPSLLSGYGYFPTLEDYGAYKIAADELFDESMSKMVKTALRRELRANGVDDKKFEILKDAAKTGDLSKVNDAFFVLKPRIVKLKRPRQYMVLFE